jgi:hypothetical protein
VWESGIKEWCDLTDQRMFFLKPLYSQVELCAGSDEVGTKFRSLEKEEKLSQSLVNKHFVFIDHWGQGVQLIMYKAKKGNNKGLCLALP